MELDFSNDMVEKLLFKQVLLGKRYLKIVNKEFNTHWIKTPGLGLMFKLVLNYYGKYNSMPNEQVVNKLVGKYIEKFPDCGITQSQIQMLFSEINSLDQLKLPNEVMVKNLDYFIKKKALLQAFDENIENLESNPDDVIDQCLAKFEKVQQIIFNDTDLGMNYFDPRCMEEHWKYVNNPEAKIKTGWDSIDFYTNGGFLKDGKSLYIFMGQAGLGKSVFLSNIAVNFLKQGLSVAVVSLEMSENVYATRFDAHISTNNINKLNDNPEDVIARIKKFYDEHKDSNLYIKEYPPRSIKTSDIELYLDNLKNAGHEIDVLVVDYLNLVLPQHSSDNMYQGALEVSEKLRALSYKFEIPVITAVQANSEGMNNENIGMEHISESRGIAHTADFIVGLYQQPEDRENGIINCRLLKNRLGGQVGKTVMMKLDPENLILRDVTSDSSYDINDAGEDNEIANIAKSLPALSSELSDFNNL